jgi:hypothetical protein
VGDGAPTSTAGGDPPAGRGSGRAATVTSSRSARQASAAQRSAAGPALVIPDAQRQSPVASGPAIKLAPAHDKSFLGSVVSLAGHPLTWFVVLFLLLAYIGTVAFEPRRGRSPDDPEP